MAEADFLRGSVGKYTETGDITTHINRESKPAGTMKRNHMFTSQ